MNKCPKCGAALPEEAHFCMHCFYSKDFVEEKKISSKGGFALRALFASKAFKAVLFSLLAVSLLAVGAVTLKSLVRPVKKVSSEDVSFIPVTAENGETVTDKNGEAVTQKVIRVTDESGENVTDESGSKVYQVVVPVTNSNGEAVTDKSGEQVYEIVTSNEEWTFEKTTSRKSIFDFLFNNGSSGKKDNHTTKSAASSSEPVTTAFQNRPTSADGSTTSGTAAIGGSTEPNEHSYSTAKNDETSLSESTYPASSTTSTTNTTTDTTIPTASDISDFEYTESDGVITITKYNGNDSYVTVPAYIDSKPVKHVGEGAFTNNSKIQTIFFESGNHYFQLFEFKNAFNNLPNLKEIIFPQNTSNLTLTAGGKEYEHFYFYKTIENCNNISGIYFGSKDNTEHGLLYSKDGVVYSRGYILVYYPPAKKDAFYAINPYCYQIDGAAFRNNPYLQHLQISRDLRYINTGHDSSHYNFLGCTALKEFSVADGNKYYSVKDGVLFYHDGSTMNGIEYYSFHYPPAKTDSYFEMIDKPLIISGSFHGNPYLETLKFFNDVSPSNFGLKNGSETSLKNIKKVIFKKPPRSYSKLIEQGIAVEVVSE